MAKRKKKKDLDFQKVKLKVGRRLKRDTNETKADFKARKIVIKEVKNFHCDPLSMLSRHSENISHHSKLSMLNHFNSILTSDVVKSLNKPIVDSLCKFIVDHSEQVRASATKCIKTCINRMRQKHSPMEDFTESLKPYLDCAYSHVSTFIQHDCQSLLDYLVKVNEPTLYETLMAVILRRYEAGNISSQGKNSAQLLKGYYERNKSRLMVERALIKNKVAPVVWTRSNFVLDFDYCLHDYFRITQNYENIDREVFLGEKEKNINVAEKFLSINFAI